METKCEDNSVLEVENFEYREGKLCYVLYVKGRSEDFRPDYVFDRMYRSVMFNMWSSEISVKDACSIVRRLQDSHVTLCNVSLNGQRIS